MHGIPSAIAEFHQAVVLVQMHCAAATKIVQFNEVGVTSHFFEMEYGASIHNFDPHVALFLEPPASMGIVCPGPNAVVPTGSMIVSPSGHMSANLVLDGLDNVYGATGDLDRPPRLALVRAETSHQTEDSNNNQ